MNQPLSDLAAKLREGQMASGQGSYERRAPSKKALPHLRDARRGLRAYVAADPSCIHAWRLLAQAEEALLDYRSARAALEQVLALSPSHDRKDLKKLALLREYERKWSRLGLTPEQLAALARSLSAGLSARSCDHTHRLTKAWLQAAQVANHAAILKALEHRGGYCDCEVLYNVAR